MDWLVWLVVIAVFVVRGLLKATNSSAGADQARSASRRARHQLRQQARQLSTGWQPPPPPPPAWPPAPSVGGWFPAPLPPPGPGAEVMAQPVPTAEVMAQPVPTAEVMAQPVPTAEVMAQPALDAQERFDDLREAAREAAQPVPSRLDALASAVRYVGSAALESTLDSTIESSLFGVAGGSLTSSVLPGAAGPTLPVELEAQVRAYLDARHEVAAVRLVCDELDVGILDALRAVRSVGGLPSS